jgi:hypothetical protein
MIVRAILFSSRWCYADVEHRGSRCNGEHHTTTVMLHKAYLMNLAPEQICLLEVGRQNKLLGITRRRLIIRSKLGNTESAGLGLYSR